VVTDRHQTETATARRACSFSVAFITSDGTAGAAEQQ
jgi:hypothetical protein